MSTQPDIILDRGESCAVCGARPSVYHPEHACWLCLLPPGECAVRGIERLMEGLEGDDYPPDPCTPPFPADLLPEGVRIAYPEE